MEKNHHCILGKLKSCKRVMIFGRPGGGKSTFALWLRNQLGLPLYHVDKFFFTENWIKRDSKEFLMILEALVSNPQWIIDGNATKTLELRYKKAEICIYFCRPLWLCLWGIFKRRFQERPLIDDRAPNSPERITWKLLSYTWGFNKRVEKLIPQLKELYPHVTFIKIYSWCDLNALKNHIKKDEISRG